MSAPAVAVSFCTHCKDECTRGSLQPLWVNAVTVRTNAVIVRVNAVTVSVNAVAGGLA